MHGLMHAYRLYGCGQMAKRRPATHGQSPFWLADQLTKLSAKKRELVNLKAADILAFAAAVIKVLYIG